LWQDGAAYDLTGLLDASGSGAVISQANSISDDGKIAVEACIYPSGNGSGKPSRCFAGLLIPTPPAAPVPAYTRYLAEGATIGGFDLFYLLQNPAQTPTTVQVRYLRAAGAPLTKSYVLPPSSRTNIWVNVEDLPGLGKALASAEFSAVIESQDNTPIIAERAMYSSAGGVAFAAGTNALATKLQ
jgi:hypothetical protein